MMVSPLALYTAGTTVSLNLHLYVSPWPSMKPDTTMRVPPAVGPLAGQCEEMMTGAS